MQSFDKIYVLNIIFEFYNIFLQVFFLSFTIYIYISPRAMERKNIH